MKSVPVRFLNNIVGPNCDNNPNVVDSFKRIPRSFFMDDALIRFAYKDEALPIGFGQTISKPSTVALMSHLLSLEPDDKVLEIGTGSGFQAAVLSRMVSAVYTVERIPQLYSRASDRIRKLFIKNVFFKLAADGNGWPDEAPFDKIIFTCAAEHVPDVYFEQLAENGLLLAPVKGKIILYQKISSELSVKEYKNCKFVEYIE